MDILYEAVQQLVELKTSAANMLVFEHMPQNTEEWHQLNRLDRKLNRPANLMVSTPSCELQNRHRTAFY
jgi:hypothetical protein